jgi:hypothetical protein
MPSILRAAAERLVLRARAVTTPQPRRIYHFHCKKTGGTSVNHAFLSLGAEDAASLQSRLVANPAHSAVSGDLIYAAWDLRTINTGNFFYAFSHQPVRRLHLPPDTFTFTCLRNPARRLVSYFDNWQRVKKNAPDRIDVFFPKSLRQCPDEFVSFLRALPPHETQHQLRMFSKSGSVEEATARIAMLDHVMFTEDFAGGLSQLSNKLDIPLAPLHKKRSEQGYEPTDADLDLAQSLVADEVRFFTGLWNTTFVPHAAPPAATGSVAAGGDVRSDHAGDGYPLPGPKRSGAKSATDSGDRPAIS